MLRNSVLTKYVLSDYDYYRCCRPCQTTCRATRCWRVRRRRGAPRPGPAAAPAQPSSPHLLCTQQTAALLYQQRHGKLLISCSTDKQEQILYYLRDSTNYIDIPIALPIAYGRCSITEEVFCLFNCVHNVTIKPLLYNDRK